MNCTCARLEVGENRRQVSGSLEHRPRGGADGRPHLVGHDVRQRRLAEPRGPEEQYVIQRLAALSRGADEEPHLLDDLGLADVVVERLRPQRHLESEILVAGGSRKELALDGHGGIVAAEGLWADSACKPRQMTPTLPVVRRVTAASALGATGRGTRLRGPRRACRRRHDERGSRGSRDGRRR